MVKKNLGPEWLRAEDFLDDGQWKQYTLTVKAVDPPGTHKSADGEEIDKPVLSFEETPKRLILCSLNQRLAKYAAGTAKATKWIGKKITLYPVTGNWFGQKNVAAIRVRVASEVAHPHIDKKTMGVDITGKNQLSS